MIMFPCHVKLTTPGSAPLDPSPDPGEVGLPDVDKRTLLCIA